MRIAEGTRGARRADWLETAIQDARYAFRGLNRNPLFALTAIMTLALGMGMSTAVFSIISSVLIKPLPYPDASRLVWLANYHKRIHIEASSGPDFADWRDQARSFEAMAGYLDVDSTVEDGAETTKNPFIITTPEFWELTGTHAILGRLFSKEDRDVIVITSRMFAQRFQSDPRVIGRMVRVDGKLKQVIGVLPNDFRFLMPASSATDTPGGIRSEPEAFTPNIISPELRSRAGGVLLMFVAARLKPGASLGQARAELRTIQARVATENPGFRGFYAASELRVIPLQERLVGASRRPLLILLAAVALVLLVACTNFSSLLLARATTRQREVATRMAMGAGHGRMIAQFAAEGLILAGLGSLSGIGFAWVCDVLLMRLSPHIVPRLNEVTIDWRVLLFALLTSLIAGAFFGLTPLISLSSRSLYAELKNGGSHVSASLGRVHFRRVLVAGEMAMALMLLTGVGLMLKSFERMYAHPAGFEPDKIGTMKVSLSGPGYGERQPKLEYSKRVLGVVSQIPGVQAVSVTSASGVGPVNVEGLRFPEGQAPRVRVREASSGYSRVVGIPLIAGRWTTDNETVPSVMVNQAFVRRVFGGQNALGRRVVLREFENRPAPIVGVVGDLKMIRLDAEAEPEILIPYQETDSFSHVNLLFKTPGSLKTVLPEVRRAVQRIDLTQPPYEVTTLKQALSMSIAPFRFDLLLLGTFAATGLLLALIGIYGVVSYSVTQRTQEIGVRIALGAQPRHITRMMLWQGMQLALCGIAAGIVGALVLARFTTALLYDVKPNDPTVFAAVAIGLAVTCLLASLVPAAQAAQLEPLQALRHE